MSDRGATNLLLFRNINLLMEWSGLGSLIGEEGGNQRRSLVNGKTCTKSGQSFLGKPNGQNHPFGRPVPRPVYHLTAVNHFAGLLTPADRMNNTCLELQGRGGDCTWQSSRYKCVLQM